MAKDVFISSHPNETWHDVADSLLNYLGIAMTEPDHGFHEGDHLHLETGEFFRSVGVSYQSIHHIDLICRWCAETGRHSGLIINDLFESTLGSFSDQQYRIISAS